MPVPDHRDYLDLIGRRCEQAASLLAGMTLEEFLNNTDAQDRAFAWNHDIGEAVNQLTTKFPDYRHRITGRRSLIGSRNVMSHRLFTRDLTELWHNLQDGVPVLREEVATLIAELG